MSEGVKVWASLSDSEKADIALETAHLRRAFELLKALDRDLAKHQAQQPSRDLGRCAWCHRLGHVADAHPLPKDHPQYDAFYDATDDELGVIVAGAIAPGRTQTESPTEKQASGGDAP